MHFTFTVEVEIEKTEGKFASRDDLGDQLREEIEAADPGNLSGENGGEYETTQWDVEEAPQPKKTRGKRNA